MSQHAWFQRAKDAGKAKAKQVAEREEVLARNSQVDEEDAAPVPPPPAPFLPPPRVQRVVTVAPPQAPLTEPARNESLVVLLQRRIDCGIIQQQTILSVYTSVQSWFGAERSTVGGQRRNYTG